jgi:hypothetical protein
MSDENLPFTFTLITNENSESRQVITRRKKPFSGKVLKDESLNLVWPAGVISLSHVALSFPPDDPLYGRWPPDTKDIIFLGQIAIKGERDLLKISNDWLLRMRYNPFYDFLERRSLAWISNIKKTEK